MISNWKVKPVEIAGLTFYQVYRHTDAANKREREETYGGYWETEADAQQLARRLNEVKK